MKPFKFYKVLVRDVFVYLKDRIFLRKLAAILMYHSVGNSAEFFTVKPEDFRWRMDYLKNNNYHVITLDSLIKLLRDKKPVSAKTVVLTFDDGYADNFTEVFPVLKKHNFPATIFLATGLIGNKDFVGKSGVKFEMLDWSQIREMHDSGLIDFEPHAAHHRKLTSISEEEAEREMKESKREIEERLNKKCSYFAYPFGRYNEKIVDLAGRYFAAALTANEGFVSRGDNLLRLNRRSADMFINKFRFKLRI